MGELAARLGRFPLFSGAFLFHKIKKNIDRKDGSTALGGKTMGTLIRRFFETLSLALKQSAELNGRLLRGKLPVRDYTHEAGAIWRYNFRNFAHPEEDPAHTAAEIRERSRRKELV